MSASASVMAFQSFEFPRLADFRPRVFVPREAMPQAMLAPEATTYGWDTVNCIRLPLVNQVLADTKQYPKDLNLTINPDENWTIATSYGPWLIAPGGSGAILMMKLPLTTAKLTYSSDTLSFDNGSVLIALKLRYVPQGGSSKAAPDANPEYIENLIADAQARSPDDPAVVVQRVDYGNAHPTDLQKSLFEAAIALLLNQNLAAFTHVFSVVNLNQQASEKRFYWLKPTYTSYAYFQGLDDANSYFAVLNQTENRSPEGLTNQIAAAAIPPGLTGSILISNKLFMQQFVMPGLPRAFTFAVAETFKLADSGQSIDLVKSVRLADVRVGAIDYTPYMNSCRIQIIGDEIQISSKVSIHISPGIDAYVDAVYYHTVGLVNKPDGSQTLTFEESAPPMITSWSTVAFWVTLTEVLVSIIGAVIAAIAGPAIKTVVRSVIAVVLITIVAGVAAAVPAVIAEVLTDGTAKALPSIGAMIEQATAPVTWPDSAGFKLRSAELNGAFQLGGMVEIIPPKQ